MDEICPLCQGHVSVDEVQCGRVTMVNGLIYHLRCLAQTTIRELEKK